jgi:pSer/pThr/pTyr-binding forkhead associated (FHA) protein
MLSGGLRWQLRSKVITIGRSKSCDIYLDMPDVRAKRLVSGQHAYLRFEQGRYILYDGSPEGKASVNGTFVNRQRVLEGGRPLEEGDTIILAAIDPSDPRPDVPGIVPCVFGRCVPDGFAGLEHAAVRLEMGLPRPDLPDLFILLSQVRRELSYRVESRQPASATAPGQLKVLTPGSDARLRLGATIELHADTSLGAGQDNDVVLGDAFVSGRHARLRWDGSAWWVEDLGSRNGTFINRKRCPPHTPQILPSGGILQVGEITFELMA